jgi:hypothetical protein
MQRVYASSSKAPCRYCGEPISINSMSLHIVRQHPRPARVALVPKLVKKAAVPAADVTPNADR